MGLNAKHERTKMELRTELVTQSLIQDERFGCFGIVLIVRFIIAHEGYNFPLNVKSRSRSPGILGHIKGVFERTYPRRANEITGRRFAWMSVRQLRSTEMHLRAHEALHFSRSASFPETFGGTHDFLLCLS
jgi:hypothetical protein